MARYSRRGLLGTAGLLASARVATGRGDRSAPRALQATGDGPPDLRWVETYDNSSADGASAATRTERGLSAVAGTTSRAVGDGGSGDGETETDAAGGDSRPWLFAIDRDGTMQWQTTLDFEGNPTVRDVAPAPGGGVLAAGELRPANAPNRALLARVSGDGTVQWRRTVSTPLAEGAVSAVVRAGDGYVLAGGTRNTERISGFLARVDAEGSARWVESEAVGNSAVLLSLVRTDGGFVGCGVSRGATGDDRTAPEAWVAAFAPDGTREWSRSYVPTTQDRRHGATFAKDLVATGDGLLAVGSTVPPGGESPLPWALSTGADGTQRAEVTFTPRGLVAGQLQAVVAHGGAYIAAGLTSNADRVAGVWFQGFDAAATQQWARRTVVGDQSRTNALAKTGGGLLAVGASAVGSGDGRDSDALALQFDGAPPTSTATPAPTPTPTPTTTRSPTPAPETAGTGGSDTETTTADGPGVGVAGALAAVALGSAALARRAGRRD